jgi:Domain of unknown function (DUF4907)
MKPTTSKTKQKKIFFIIIACLLMCGGIAYAIHYYQLKRHRDYILVQLQAIQTSSGWGYEILTDGKVYIKQVYIPAIQGKRSFRSKEEALLVGNKVLDKIEHKQMPVISLDELKEMHITNDSAHNR